MKAIHVAETHAASSRVLGAAGGRVGDLGIVAGSRGSIGVPYRIRTGVAAVRVLYLVSGKLAASP
jgi:hypothetical protein